MQPIKPAPARVAAVPVAEIDLAPFGSSFSLSGEGAGVSVASGHGWVDVSTAQPLVRAPAHLGMTLGAGLPFTTHRMERHLYTEEAILCMEAPVVLAMAPATSALQPSAVEVVAVLLEPGEVVVMAPGTWHDACHGINGPARYYWLATAIAGDEPEWVEIAGGPVEIAC